MATHITGVMSQLIVIQDTVYRTVKIVISQLNTEIEKAVIQPIG